MPRVARIVVEFVPHNGTQRGENGQDVFFIDEHRWVYLSLPKDLLRNPRKLYTTVDMGAYEYMECDEDGDCTVFPKLKCRMTDRLCVQCLNDAHCPHGETCQPGGLCGSVQGGES